MTVAPLGPGVGTACRAAGPAAISRLVIAAMLSVLLSACERENREAASGGQERPGPAAPGSELPVSQGSQWIFKPALGSAVLQLEDRAGKPVITLACHPGEGWLEVNVPGFSAIGSEERLSFGSDGAVEALVADVEGDRERGGVTAKGAIPANLAALVAGEISASYGAQTSGPHPAMGREAAAAFVARCKARAAPGTARVPPVSACRLQDGEPIDVASLRAVGTEPFWSASIEGRCVTYSHPDDQQGTRVWTRYRAGPGGGIWSGALGGRLFELHMSEKPGCSDGMSDKRYPMAVMLLVNGERRNGCAEYR